MNNTKLSYYLFNVLLQCIPKVFFRWILEKKLNNNDMPKWVDARVNYYNKISSTFLLEPKNSTLLLEYKREKSRVYYLDLYHTIKYFPLSYRMAFLNGDIIHVPEQPTFLKSRPISSDNQNSVILKLNKIRHFKFINDPTSYQNKKNIAVWRGTIDKNKPHRKVVVQQFYNHPLCNIGQTKPSHAHYQKGVMSIKKQLQYKFILAIEGNDVASNLKWVMSSNSIAVMSKPKFETWFMEGLLQAGVHYIEVKGDYSDLPEKIEYYLAHEEEALKIIKNAHQWVEQFKDPKKEKLIELLVAKKYFELSE